MSLRQAATNRSRQLQRDNAVTRPSIRRTTNPPVRGLNSRDNIEDIRSDEAFVMINMMPDIGGVESRQGCKTVNQIFDNADHKRLMKWASGNTEKLLASYELGGANLLMDPEDSWTTVVDNNNHNWSTANINTFLVMVNGVDHLTWDGSAGAGGIISLSLTVSGSSWSSAANGVMSFKGRAYYWSTDGLRIWYTKPGAHQGLLDDFPLDSVAQHGGSILSLNTWTRDGGSGPDDFFVITTNQGEVIVYQGTDPTDWSLVGRYVIPQPVSQFGFLENEGKIYVITRADLEILPDAFFRGPKTKRSSRISGRIRQAVRANPSNTGDWQLLYDNTRNRIMVNIPRGGARTSTLVRGEYGWSEWEFLNALSWQTANGEMYFISGDQFDGDANNLWQMSGSKDFTGESDTVIQFDVRQGYALLGTNAQKRVAMYRPAVQTTSGTINISTQLSFDVANEYGPTNGIIIPTGGAVSPWGPPSGGVTPWGPASGGSSPWGTTQRLLSEWLVGYGTGQRIALRMFGTLDKEIRWSATDWELVIGGGF